MQGLQNTVVNFPALLEQFIGMYASRASKLPPQRSHQASSRVNPRIIEDRK
jgi:hypothetical protein